MSAKCHVCRPGSRRLDAFDDLVYIFDFVIYRNDDRYVHGVAIIYDIADA